MVTTKGYPDSRHKSMYRYSFDKEDYPKIKVHLDRVHFPETISEKDRFRTMLTKVYDIEHKYQTGKITRNERDEQIEIAEDEYDKR